MNAKPTDTTTELRLPPQKLDFERGLVGALLLDESKIDDAAEALPPEMFYSEANAIVYRAMLAMRSSGAAVDANLVAEHLNKTGQLDDIGGMHELFTFLEKAPDLCHVPEYVKPIRDTYRRRLALDAGRKLIDLAYDQTTPIDEALGKAESIVHQAIEGGGSKGLKPIGDILVNVIDELENPKPGVIVPTGFSDIDAALRGGLRGGNQIILAARPSVGKTALACCICQNLIRSGYPALFVSFEMTEAEVAERMVAATGIPLSQFSERLPDVKAAARELYRLPFYVDASQPNLNQLVATIRIAARKGVRLIVVDYLQLVPPEDSRAQREAQVAGVSRRLKQVALSCGVTILALSQLNRQVEMRDSQRPKLSDLRESGAIEQDADVVLMLWRPNKGSDSGNEPDNCAMLDMAKNRNGACRIVQLTWRGSTATFGTFDPADGF